MPTNVSKSCCEIHCYTVRPIQRTMITTHLKVELKRFYCNRTLWQCWNTCNPVSSFWQENGSCYFNNWLQVNMFVWIYFSVCRSSFNVHLDGRCQDPWAVHSRMWIILVLVAAAGRFCHVYVATTGLEGHHRESLRLGLAGQCFV